MGARTFTDLIVWQKSYALSLKVHALTKSFPPSEYRLIDQMRAASSSIPMNIAEGFGRFTPKDQANFYAIARGSGDELKVQLMLSQDYGYCADTSVLVSLAEEVCAMLYRLRQKVLLRDSGR